MAQSSSAGMSENGMTQHEEQPGIVDEQKAKAAGALRDVAQMMRERVTGAPLPGADRAAAAAARPLESGAAYIEQHSPGDMWGDLMQFCKAHPAGALGIGFLVGYLFHKLLR